MSVPVQDGVMPLAAFGSVDGQPKLWLRLEGGFALAASTYLHAQATGSWWVFAALFFTPDVSFVGYLAAPAWARGRTTSSTRMRHHPPSLASRWRPAGLLCLRLSGRRTSASIGSSGMG